MHTKETTTEIDQAILAVLSEEVTAFVESANSNLANAKLRIADIEIDRHLREEYGLALREELGTKFKERLYYITVSDYTGRNGRHFVDIAIEMKRGLLI